MSKNGTSSIKLEVYDACSSERVRFINFEKKSDISKEAILKDAENKDRSSLAAWGGSIIEVEWDGENGKINFLDDSGGEVRESFYLSFPE